MKPVFAFFFLTLSAVMSCNKDLPKSNHKAPCCAFSLNPAHLMKESLQTIIDRYIDKGIPDIQVALKNKNGWYFASGGYNPN